MQDLKDGLSIFNVPLMNFFWRPLLFQSKHIVMLLVLPQKHHKQNIETYIFAGDLLNRIGLNLFVVRWAATSSWHFFLRSSLDPVTSARVKFIIKLASNRSYKKVLYQGEVHPLPNSIHDMADLFRLSQLALTDHQMRHCLTRRTLCYITVEVVNLFQLKSRILNAI